MQRELKHRILDGIALSLLEGPPADPGQPNIAWHMIAVEGSWDGHTMGSFSLDRAMLKQMVDNARGLKVEIPADYEHATFWSAMFGGKAPASGWIQGMEVRDGGGGEAQLWARFSWTNTAAAHIREREYRYLSPVIIFNSRDRKSGKLAGAAIHSVALTNTPFLEELPEVRLNSLPTFTTTETDGPEPPEEQAMNEEQKRALCKALGLSESATAEEITAAASRSTVLADTAAAALSALGLEADVAKDKVIAAITVLKNPANDPGEVAVLRARMAELEGDKAQREADKLVARALSEGKLTAPGTAQHAWALKFARQDQAAFREWSAAAPKVIPARIPTPTEPPAALVLDDQTKKYCTQLGLTDDDIKEAGPAVLGR